MTRQFNQHVDCPKCKHRFPAETAFCRWMREQTELDSVKESIVRSDCDHIVHRYRFPGSGRNVQGIMIIEVKTCVDMTLVLKIPMSQADSLHIINQIVRNRSDNMYKKAKWQCSSVIKWVTSLITRSRVMVRFYGVHGLYFSGTDPTDSDRIMWDTHTIDRQTLLQLLRFELDPDTLRPLDLRIHQKKRQGTFDDLT